MNLMKIDAETAVLSLQACACSMKPYDILEENPRTTSRTTPLAICPFSNLQISELTGLLSQPYTAKQGPP